MSSQQIRTRKADETALSLFKRHYGYDPYERLADGGSIWFRQMPQRPFRTCAVNGLIVGIAVGSVLSVPSAHHSPPWATIGLLACLGALAGAIVAYGLCNDGLRIARDGLTFRRKHQLTDLHSEDVDLFVAEAGIELHGGWLFQWKQIRIIAGQELLRLRALWPWELKIAYDLLAEACPMATGLAPDGTVDLGSELAQLQPGRSLRGAAQLLQPEMDRQIRRWFWTTLGSGVLAGVSVALAVAAIRAARLDGQSRNQAVIFAVTFITAAGIAFTRWLMLRAREQRVLAAIDGAMSGKPLDLNELSPRPQPDATPPATIAWTIAGLVLCLVPLFGLLVALGAVSQTAKTHGLWRRLSLASLIASIGVLLALAALLAVAVALNA